VKVKKLISLFLIELDHHFSITKRRYSVKKNKGELVSLIAMIASISVLIIVYFLFYFNILNTNLKVYTEMDIQQLFLTNFIMLSGLFGFFLGAFVLIGEFFSNKDLKVLITLPLEPHETIFGKLFIVLFDQMIISLLLLLPALIYFGIYTKQSAVYYIISIIVFLLSQIFPVMTVLLYTLIVSNFLKRFKRKELLLYLSTALLIIIVAVLLFFSGNTFSINIENSQELPDITINPDSILSRLAWVYPPAFLATKALSTIGVNQLIWLLMFLGFHMLLFVLTYFLGNRFYYSFYSILSEQVSSKKTGANFEEETWFSKASNPEKALLKREWYYFLKTPAFSVNGFANVLVFPIMLIIFAIIFSKIGVTEEIFEQILGYNIFIVALISVFSSSLNGLSYSCFSREGHLLKELKMLPIEIEQILKAKIIHIYQISSIGFLSGLIIGTIFFKLNFFEFLGTILFSVMVNIFLNLIQMLVDVSNPYLDWDNPQKAMKENVNGLFATLIIFGFLGVFGFLIYKLVPIVNSYVLLACLTILFLILNFLIWRLLKNKTYQLLTKEL
jgi:ABC-2 type transport system permease protein